MLDFGIAKVGEVSAPAHDDDPAATIIEDMSGAAALTGAQLETDTLMQPLGDDNHSQQFKVNADSESVGTLLQDSLTNPLLSKSDHAHSADDDGTLLFDEPGTRHAGRHTAHIATSQQGPALTRVGAIMGTPLYMSPEQCGGGYVDTRSDIYSLGVIAYQMLAGEPPFAGNTSAVMRAHREQTPQHLRDHETKIPKRAAGVIMSALSKNPAERPQTAFAFGSALRGQSEGIGTLYRRAFSLYSEYFPKFLKLSFLAHLPVIVTTALLIGLFVLDKYLPHPSSLAQKIAMGIAMVIVGLLQIIAYTISSSVISGVTAVIITQLSAAPLRPVKLRVAFGVLKKRWRPFLKTVFRVTLRIIIGFVLLIIPGIIIVVRYSLYAPVVLIEGLEGKAAMKRARQLASRSWRTIIIVSIIQIIIPMIVSALVGRIRVGVDLEKASLAHRIYQQVLGLVNIFVLPLISIVPALLYIKMRQLGGEPLSTALAQIEEAEAKESSWQKRMRTRLSLHTPISQKTTSS